VIDLDDLNPEQRTAVEYGEGPLLVISAAGSGKTRVLTHRAAYLISEGVLPEDLMLATFTRKAAQEMTSRVAGLIGEVRAQGIRAGTMHSLFLRVLKVEGWPWPSFEILDEHGQKRLLKDIMGPAGYDIAQVLGEISLWKNELVRPRRDVYEHQWYLRYEEAKADQHVIDFDDMLVETVRLFEARPDLLEAYQPGWLLVDEAQDTSLAQWRALELLSGAETADEQVVTGSAEGLPAHEAGDAGARGVPHSPAGTRTDRPINITCVGDPRQSIYGWRGAQDGVLYDFEARFPGAAVIDLPKNYRSTPPIVATANMLIRHAERKLEDMAPVRSEGMDVLWSAYLTSDTEAAVIAQQIGMDDTHRGGDFAILYRINSYSRAFEQALAEAQIPYTVIGSKGFFGRMEVTDILSYLRLIVDPKDAFSLRRIVNRPTRYLGRAFCDQVEEAARTHGTDLLAALTWPTRISNRQRDAAWRLGISLNKIREMLGDSITAAIRYIRSSVGYDSWLLREEGSGGRDEDRIENLNELEQVAGRFGADLSALLAFVDQQLAKSSSDSNDPDKVQLMTVHRSKGLEWPVVFVVGMSDEILPHRRCLDRESLEEERRLAYVAFTRARDELYVSSVREWQGKELGPSRFLAEAGLLSKAKESVA
jgi:DNA helicase-2/ATP-dependent DNA helicase PcrA